MTKGQGDDSSKQTGTDMDDTGRLAHRNTSLKLHSTSYTVWAPDAQRETLAISSF